MLHVTEIWKALQNVENGVVRGSVVTVLKILQAVGFGRIREEKPRFRIRFLDENIINLCNVYRPAIQYPYIKRPKKA